MHGVSKAASIKKSPMNHASRGYRTRVAPRAPRPSGPRFSSNNGSMIVHCWSVRSMPVRYDGSTVTVYEKTSNLTLIAVRLRNATPSVFHQRHIGRVLRSS